jgi:hypothetical protein
MKAVVLAVVLGLSAGGLSADASTQVQARSGTGIAPRPPLRVCGQNLLRGPERLPKGAVRVPAGDDSHVIGENWLVKARTVYWLAPGIHTLGTGKFGQIQPANGDVFVGGYNPKTGRGAVIDGQGVNETAFGGSATHVTLEYLTIQHFVPPGNQYAVNGDQGTDWTVEYDTVQDNGDTRGSELGAALGLGPGNVVEHNCLTHNGQYGMNAGGYETEFNYNEVSWNGISFFPDLQCGCSGGIKYWDATDATVVGNYIHDNYDAGLWADTDNAGFLVKDNYIADNWASGVIYEISYNADITANTFVDNGWGVGSYAAGTFPYGEAIYLSGSGGDANVASDYAGVLDVTDNLFMDNWDGVLVYQNPNRLCGSSANSSTGYCTRGHEPSYTSSSCSAHVDGGSPLERPDYWDGCQWKAQHVTVSHNQFDFNPMDIATAKAPLPDETLSRCPVRASEILETGDNASAPGSANLYWCGFNGMFSLPGSASGGPGAGWTVSDAIMDLTSSTGESPDDNVWADNIYNGPWAFQAYAQGQSPARGDLFPRGVPTTVRLGEWQTIWHQDEGSTSGPALQLGASRLAN